MIFTYSIMVLDTDFYEKGVDLENEQGNIE